MSILHTFVSGLSDDPDNTLVQPSDWNAVHVIDAATFTRAQYAPSGKCWEYLGRTELGSAASTLSHTLTGTARGRLAVFIYVPSLSVARNILLRFNGDSASNYAAAVTIGNAAVTSLTAQTSISLDAIGTTSTNARAFELIILNKAAKSKRLNRVGLAVPDTGAAAAPTWSRGSALWNNTANLISSIDLLLSGGGNFAAGSYIDVWGRDED
jgi:hypothetical protein